MNPANISPLWLGATGTKADDFQRLLKTIKFKHLITAHGEPLKDTASEQVAETVNRVFPDSDHSPKSFISSISNKIMGYFRSLF